MIIIMLIIIKIEKINNNNNNNNNKKFVRLKNLLILSIHIYGLLQDDMYSIQFLCQF